MRGLRPVLLAVLLVAITAPRALPESQVPGDYNVVERVELAAGVEYFSLTHDTPAEKVYVAR